MILKLLCYLRLNNHKVSVLLMLLFLTACGRNDESSQKHDTGFGRRLTKAKIHIYLSNFKCMRTTDNANDNVCMISESNLLKQDLYLQRVTIMGDTSIFSFNYSDKKYFHNLINKRCPTDFILSVGFVGESNDIAFIEIGDGLIFSYIKYDKALKKYFYTPIRPYPNCKIDWIRNNQNRVNRFLITELNRKGLL